jgi:hypothetical protein
VRLFSTQTASVLTGYCRPPTENTAPFMLLLLITFMQAIYFKNHVSELYTSAVMLFPMLNVVCFTVVLPATCGQCSVWLLSLVSCCSAVRSGLLLTFVVVIVVVVGTATALRAGRSVDRIPAGTKDFSHFQNVQTLWRKPCILLSG